MMLPIAGNENGCIDAIKANPRLIGLNGSYFVIRQLKQDVEGLGSMPKLTRSSRRAAQHQWFYPAGADGAGGTEKMPQTPATSSGSCAPKAIAGEQQCRE